MTIVEKAGPEAADARTAPLLEVRDLHVEFHTRDGIAKAVQTIEGTKQLVVIRETGIVRPDRPIAHRTAVDRQHLARPTLAHLIIHAKVSHGFPPGDGRYHFFDATSLSMALSSIASANSFFSLAFSSSSAFSRLASETSRPPYLAFHL